MLKAALAAAALLLAGAAQDSEDKLVTVLTSPEPHTQLIVIALTMQTVQEGAQTRVLLCGGAGDGPAAGGVAKAGADRSSFRAYLPCLTPARRDLLPIPSAPTLEPAPRAAP